MTKLSLRKEVQGLIPRNRGEVQREEAIKETRWQGSCF